MQILWPDRSGKFPGQEGFDESMAQDVTYNKKPHLALV
jgi:hypothetical protein